MYIEHDADRLNVLVARTAAGLGYLDEPGRERALAALQAIVRQHAGQYHDAAFADRFTAAFVAAVHQRIAAAVGDEGSAGPAAFVVGQADVDPAFADWA